MRDVLLISCEALLPALPQLGLPAMTHEKTGQAIPPRQAAQAKTKGTLDRAPVFARCRQHRT
jgi:hypothetical protein